MRSLLINIRCSAHVTCLYQVRNKWIRSIMLKPWGYHVRTRVSLRNVLGREPEKVEVDQSLENGVAFVKTRIALRDLYGEEPEEDEVLLNMEDDVQEITEDDITLAYNMGEEVGCLRTMLGEPGC